MVAGENQPEHSKRYGTKSSSGKSWMEGYYRLGMCHQEKQGAMSE